MYIRYSLICQNTHNLRDSYIRKTNFVCHGNDQDKGRENDVDLKSCIKVIISDNITLAYLKMHLWSNK